MVPTVAARLKKCAEMPVGESVQNGGVGAAAGTNPSERPATGLNGRRPAPR